MYSNIRVNCFANNFFTGFHVCETFNLWMTCTYIRQKKNLTVSNILVVTISLRFASSSIRSICDSDEIRYPGNSFLVNRVSWVSDRHVCAKSLETNGVENKYRNISGDNWWRLSAVHVRGHGYFSIANNIIHIEASGWGPG